MHLFTMISFVVVGLLFIGISIPLILRKIPPNWTYGFKVPKTLGNTDVWYKANEIFGKQLAIAGVVITLASIGLGLLRLPNFGYGSDFTYAMLMVLVMSVSSIIALIISLIYLKTL